MSRKKATTSKIKSVPEKQASPAETKTDWVNAMHDGPYPGSGTKPVVTPNESDDSKIKRIFNHFDDDKTIGDGEIAQAVARFYNKFGTFDQQKIIDKAMQGLEPQPVDKVGVFIEVFKRLTEGGIVVTARKEF